MMPRHMTMKREGQGHDRDMSRTSHPANWHTSGTDRDTPLKGVPCPGANAQQWNSKMKHTQSEAICGQLGRGASSVAADHRFPPICKGSFPWGTRRGDSDPLFVRLYKKIWIVRP